MSTPFPRPEPEPVPQPPAPAPFPPKPVREPDPEGLPDEVPLPNPDENDSPPQHAGGYHPSRMPGPGRDPNGPAGSPDGGC